MGNKTAIRTETGWDFIDQYSADHTRVSKAYFDSQDVLRWESNDNPCPIDALRSYGVAIPPRQADAIDDHTQAVLAQYRKERETHGYSQEELAEMRAAFGPGETVVDIVTGKQIKL